MVKCCVLRFSGGDFINLDSVLEFHPFDDLGQPVRSVQPAPGSLGAEGEFEDHGGGGFPGETASGLGGAQPHRGEGRFDGVGGADVNPVLRWKIVENQQSITILGEAVGGLGILGLIGVDEEIESLPGLLPAFRHPDLMKTLLGLLLKGFGQFVEHVGRLVHPTALLARFAINLAQRRPKTQCAIAGGKFWPHLQSP